MECTEIVVSQDDFSVVPGDEIENHQGGGRAARRRRKRQREALALQISEQKLERNDLQETIIPSLRSPPEPQGYFKYANAPPGFKPPRHWDRESHVRMQRAILDSTIMVNDEDHRCSLPNSDSSGGVNEGGGLPALTAEQIDAELSNVGAQFPFELRLKCQLRIAQASDAQLRALSRQKAVAALLDGWDFDYNDIFDDGVPAYYSCRPPCSSSFPPLSPPFTAPSQPLLPLLLPSSSSSSSSSSSVSSSSVSLFPMPTQSPPLLPGRGPSQLQRLFHRVVHFAGRDDLKAMNSALIKSGVSAALPQLQLRVRAHLQFAGGIGDGDGDEDGEGTVSEQTEWLQLPGAVLGVVLTFLPLHTALCSAIITCKAWYLAGCTESVWRVWGAVLRAAPGSGVHLKALCRKLRHVTQLDLSHLPNLNDGDDKEESSGERAVKCLMQYAPSITSLNLSYTACSDLALQSISKGRSSNALRALDLEGCSSITDQGVRDLAMRCPSLEEVRLAGCYRLSSNAMNYLAVRCRNLTSLDLSRCSVGDMGLIMLSRYGKRIQKLILRDCTRVTDYGVVELTKLPLQELDLSGCRVNQTGIDAVKGVPVLRYGLLDLVHL